jgi:hypothetical protein
MPMPHLNRQCTVRLVAIDGPRGGPPAVVKVAEG